MSWTFERLAGPYTLTEGPAWDGGGLLFSDIMNDRILRYDEASGRVDVHRTGTNSCQRVHRERPSAAVPRNR